MLFFPAYEPDPFSLTANIGAGILLFTMSFMFIGAFTIPFIMYLLPRRFDSKFGCALMGYGSFIKSSWYSLGVAAPKWLIRKKSGSYRLFNGYDFWEHANKFERALCCISFYSMSLTIIGLIIFLFHYLIYCFRIWIS
ncbi:MAG: hypothetical protein JSR33_04045 [Proteobacteria bacterium]|nr:hypothetical protein [Pseudomonadota bacterium]